MTLWDGSIGEKLNGCVESFRHPNSCDSKADETPFRAVETRHDAQRHDNQRRCEMDLGIALGPNEGSDARQCVTKARDSSRKKSHLDMMDSACAGLMERAWRFGGEYRDRYGSSLRRSYPLTVNDMLEGVFWVFIGLSMAAPLGLVIALVKRRLIGSWWAFLLWAIAMFCSMGAFGVVGMDYEDFGKPLPLWLVTGFTLGQVGLFGALGGICWRLWQLWSASRGRVP